METRRKRKKEVVGRLTYVNQFQNLATDDGSSELLQAWSEFRVVADSLGGTVLLSNGALLHAFTYGCFCFSGLRDSKIVVTRSASLGHELGRGESRLFAYASDFFNRN